MRFYYWFSLGVVGFFIWVYSEAEAEVLMRIDENFFHYREARQQVRQIVEWESGLLVQEDLSVKLKAARERLKTTAESRYPVLAEAIIHELDLLHRLWAEELPLLHRLASDGTQDRQVVIDYLKAQYGDSLSVSEYLESYRDPRFVETSRSLLANLASSVENFRRDFLDRSPWATQYFRYMNAILESNNESYQSDAGRDRFMKHYFFGDKGAFLNFVKASAVVQSACPGWLAEISQ